MRERKIGKLGGAWVRGYIFSGMRVSNDKHIIIMLEFCGKTFYVYCQNLCA